MFKWSNLQFTVLTNGYFNTCRLNYYSIYVKKGTLIMRFNQDKNLISLVFITIGLRASYNVSR